MRRVSDVVAFLAVGIVAGALGNQALHAQSPSVKNTPVLRTDMTGLQGTEGYLNIVEQDPGGIGRNACRRPVIKT